MQDFLRDLLAYWSADEIRINLVILMNLAGALALGSLVGYERAFHGRAAGMRTYGLVCMASAGLTVISGQPGHWFGGAPGNPVAADPTRVIQGIVTGIGFLGAGVIMKEGLSISGLTTAASIWTASCIGVLIGVGFYAAAILLAAVSAALMMWGPRLEASLPAHPAIRVRLRLRAGSELHPAALDEALARLGYAIAAGSMSVSTGPAEDSFGFIIVARNRRDAAPMPPIARALGALAGVVGVGLEHARN